MRQLILSVGFFMCACVGLTQVPDKSELFSVPLKDGTKVWLVKGLQQSTPHVYYYLPVRLRISQRVDRMAEFSFMPYRANENGPFEGAILNFLLVWGLTAEEEKTVERELQAAIDTNAVIGGAVSIEVPEGQPSVVIHGKNAVADMLRRWNVEPVASVLPGTKIAFSYRLNGEETEQFLKALDDAKLLHETSVELGFVVRGYAGDLWNGKFGRNTYSLAATLKELFAVLPSRIPSR
jgi:hypothetical protein